MDSEVKLEYAIMWVLLLFSLEQANFRFSPGIPCGREHWDYCSWEGLSATEELTTFKTLL